MLYLRDFRFCNHLTQSSITLNINRLTVIVSTYVPVFHICDHFTEYSVFDVAITDIITERVKNPKKAENRVSCAGKKLKGASLLTTRFVLTGRKDQNQKLHLRNFVLKYPVDFILF